MVTCFFFRPGKGVLKSSAAVIVACCLLMCFPSDARSARIETRFGPIFFETKDQVISYGRSLRPLLSPAYRTIPIPADFIISRHESIFETVCEKLDIKLQNLKTSVRIVASLKELREEYKRLVPDSDMPVIAFYSHNDKTIWYAQESLSRELILHETAHAVLDHYFVQPIPAKIDEIIAEKLEQFY